jgi:FtsH-binding integral membrane protein
VIDMRALGRISLTLGTLGLIATAVVAARYHVSERDEQLLLVAALSAGVFLTVAGLASWLSEKPLTEAEEERQLALAQEQAGGPPSATKAVAVYILVLSIVTGVIVGVATDDVGSGIQTFTFGLILSGVIWGLGVLLGYRPPRNERPR